MSKFSLPYLRHECVPKTFFLDRVDRIPADLENYVLKPLFSFAGLGVIINVTQQDLAAIPKEKPFAVHPARAHAIRACNRDAIRP